MAKKKTNAAGDRLKNVEDYRHKGAKRKNNPPAKIAAEGKVPVLPKIEYSYGPRRPPVLRFDSSGRADRLPELLADATRRKLTEDEARLLAAALRTQEPWLEWAGKREAEAKGFSVDPVALHIHERISAQAILRVAARQDVERTLFGDPEQEYHEAVQFYQHDIDWTNRLILGDSLHVMASLAHREDLAGRVQMIYIDPPYGIKYGSNFQPEVGRRDVKDKESDLTRELETVKAYRDTWHIGVHSYLTYLRERLIIGKEVLADTGSIFVQISDENAHRVRNLLDEVFGSENFGKIICVQKTGGLSQTLIPGTTDYVLWYAKDITKVKYRQIYLEKDVGESSLYQLVELPSGEHRRMNEAERNKPSTLPPSSKVFRHTSLESANPRFPFEFQGKVYNQRWKSNTAGLVRLGLRVEGSIQRVTPYSTGGIMPIFQWCSSRTTGLTQVREVSSNHRCTLSRPLSR
jgi:adenine-specific DNA-methyltransferase